MPTTVAGPARVRIETRSVSGSLPFEWHHAVARLENDRDLAGGRPLTGFELDYVEELERIVAQAEEDLFLFGNAFFRVDRGA